MTLMPVLKAAKIIKESRAKTAQEIMEESASIYGCNISDFHDKNDDRYIYFRHSCVCAMLLMDSISTYAEIGEKFSIHKLTVGRIMNLYFDCRPGWELFKRQPKKIPDTLKKLKLLPSVVEASKTISASGLTKYNDMLDLSYSIYKIQKPEGTKRKPNRIDMHARHAATCSMIELKKRLSLTQISKLCNIDNKTVSVINRKYGIRQL